MASLSKFRRDTSIIKQGQWVTVGENDDTFEILTRGSTAPFRDAIARYRHDAVRDLNRKRQPGSDAYDLATLPPSVDDACLGRALVEHCVLDLRGLSHDDAGQQPVTLDEFRDMLRDPETFGGLAGLAFAAVGRVNENATAERAEAVGNSLTPSATTYSTATSGLG